MEKVERPCVKAVLCANCGFLREFGKLRAMCPCTETEVRVACEGAKRMRKLLAAAERIPVCVTEAA